MGRRVVIIAAVTVALIAAHVGSASASPPDRPNIASIAVSPSHPHVGDSVTVDAKAFDRGSVDYFVYLLSPNLANVVGMTCIGEPNGPSPDGPACEFDSNTTTTRSITHTIITFVPDAPGDTEITACAVIAGDPPETGDCRTVVVSVS